MKIQNTELTNKDDILKRITAEYEAFSALNKDTRYLIAIDGRCGAGKSTLAKYLADSLSAELVQMDDFFLPPKLRTNERYSEPGGNVDYERFSAEVVPNLRSLAPFKYGKFNCTNLCIDQEVLIGKSRILIVEGTYSLRPEWRKLYDLKIFCDADRDTRISRIAARSGDGSLHSFINKWMPLEELYFEKLGSKSIADIVFLNI